MLSVKQSGVKYHFLSLSYDSTWDWTLVSRAIGNPPFLFQPCQQSFEYKERMLTPKWGVLL